MAEAVGGFRPASSRCACISASYSFLLPIATAECSSLVPATATAADFSPPAHPSTLTHTHQIAFLRARGPLSFCVSFAPPPQESARQAGDGDDRVSSRGSMCWTSHLRLGTRKSLGNPRDPFLRVRVLYNTTEWGRGTANPTRGQGSGGRGVTGVCGRRGMREEEEVGGGSPGLSRPSSQVVRKVLFVVCAAAAARDMAFLFRNLPVSVRCDGGYPISRYPWVRHFLTATDQTPNSPQTGRRKLRLGGVGGQSAAGFRRYCRPHGFCFLAHRASRNH